MQYKDDDAAGETFKDLVRSGNVDGVKRFAKSRNGDHDGGINFFFDKIYTPIGFLVVAILDEPLPVEKCVEMTHLLLQSGADITVARREKMRERNYPSSFLHYAARSKDLFKTLVENDPYGITGERYAFFMGATDSCPDVSQRGKLKDLVYSANSKHWSHRAEPSERKKEGWCAIL